MSQSSVEQGQKRRKHYRVSGRVLPEQGGWWFDLIGIDRELFSIRAEASESKFWATLECEPGFLDDEPMNVRSVLEPIVQTALDTIGLFNGCAVLGEVLEMELPNGETIPMNSSFGGLGIEYSSEEFASMAVAGLSVRGIWLALGDFRMAIRVPVETPFFAYRGLDSLRADLAERLNLKGDKESWRQMRNVTGIGWEEIDAIKPKADLRRHGSVANVSQEEREVALRLLQKALIAYWKWCLTNVPELQRAE